MSDVEIGFTAIGVVGQLLFASRFVVQWIASERKGESVIPVSFWWLSLGGSLLLIVYLLYKMEWVVLLGQFGVFLYVRNLVLMHRSQQVVATVDRPVPRIADDTMSLRQAG